MQFFGHGNEITQMTQLHGKPPSGRKTYQTGRTIYWILSLASYMIFSLPDCPRAKVSS
jgi:hypothetical protein